MSKTASPLRYPGGKSCMQNTVSAILLANDLTKRSYAEPFAGGCGLALSLLYDGLVSDIHINDIDPAIWAFWHSVLFETEDFVSKIRYTDVTMDEWYKQKAINNATEEYGVVEIGFSAFFLNRTNRSGIIKRAGVIGGYSQTGNYKIDCRFNKDDLIDRIYRIKKYSSRIHLYNHDALDFLNRVETSLPEKTFLCIDPPYYNKGASLYTSFYHDEDHRRLAEKVMKLTRPWVLTYDDVHEIRSLYSSLRQYQFSLNYSVQQKRVGQEVLIASNKLLIPDSANLPQMVA